MSRGIGVYFAESLQNLTFSENYKSETTRTFENGLNKGFSVKVPCQPLIQNWLNKGLFRDNSAENYTVELHTG